MVAQLNLADLIVLHYPRTGILQVYVDLICDFRDIYNFPKEGSYFDQVRYYPNLSLPQSKEPYTAIEKLSQQECLLPIPVKNHSFKLNFTMALTQSTT